MNIVPCDDKALAPGHFLNQAVQILLRFFNSDFPHGHTYTRHTACFVPAQVH